MAKVKLVFQDEKSGVVTVTIEGFKAQAPTVELSAAEELALELFDRIGELDFAEADGEGH